MILHTISITISGKVQGVFFRQSTREKANALGITGFVKNQADETVYIEATGTEKQLQELTDWCRQGPPKARVNKIATTKLPLHVFDNFSIARS